MNNPPLIAIVGPTASGKSSLGLRVAQEFGGEIIVCDSTQVYRGFDIGTSKPADAERTAAPHHLLDLLEPDELFTAGAYRDRATEVLQDLRERQRLPVMTVGTGLYMRALIDGFSDTPERSEEVRARLRASAARHGADHLHRTLKRIDRSAAARIGPRVIKIGLMPPRTSLYERINRRTVEMMDRGWLAEVRSLTNKGISATAKPFSFIGYGELRECLEGNQKLPACVAAIQQSTRRYAKRQLTWFRKEQGVRWFEGFGDDSRIAIETLKYLKKEMGREAMSA
jgi:tRNA dimethylallyltransferase